MEQDGQHLSQGGAFTNLRGQIEHLAEAAEAVVTSGHLDLGPDLWLSSDPAGRAVMTCRPAEDGFILRLEEGDSGAWACLGMRFDADTLKGARYLGLIVAQRAGDVVSITPTLRYFLPEGLRDVPAAPLLSAGSMREQLAWMPVDPEAVAQAKGCELNLFFQTNAFVADFARIEPVLII